MTTSYLTRVLCGDSDHGRHSPFLLDQVQAWSLRVRSITQAVNPMEITCISCDPQDGLGGTSEHWNLQIPNPFCFRPQYITVKLGFMS